MKHLFNILVLLSTGLHGAIVLCQQPPQQQSQVLQQPQTPAVEPPSDIPYPAYLQSPLAPNLIQPETIVAIDQQHIAQRSMKSKQKSAARNLDIDPSLIIINSTNPQSENTCLYDKRYFFKFDECLEKKPYPTIGLPAFKNEDLLVKKGLTDKHGCAFIMNNGLFKNYQVSQYRIHNDNQCLDGTKVGMSLSFSNLTLSYLWTLRCLNRADQLLDDATLDGKTSSESFNTSTENLCVGSSQSFGFTSLLLSGVEAEIELATDIYKNWRVTNVTVAMLSMSPTSSTARMSSGTNAVGDHVPESDPPILATNIKEFLFESIDGDELNWRYIQLFQNWARNQMHSNFLYQYRRFLWVSLQRCLSESSEKLPVKLNDIFNS